HRNLPASKSGNQICMDNCHLPRLLDSSYKIRNTAEISKNDEDNLDVFQPAAFLQSLLILHRRNHRIFLQHIIESLVHFSSTHFLHSDSPESEPLSSSVSRKKAERNKTTSLLSCCSPVSAFVLQLRKVYHNAVSFTRDPAEILMVSDILFYCLFDPFFYLCCNLRRFHVFVFFVIHRFQKMNLYSHRFDAVCIKRLKCVNQCHRNDRTFCLCCRFEASSFESPRFISLFRSCSLRKNQVISSTFHFICHIDDDLHGLPDILPVNHV